MNHTLITRLSPVSVNLCQFNSASEPEHDWVCLPITSLNEARVRLKDFSREDSIETLLMNITMLVSSSQ